tara:strand:+ start:8745 stop:9269 length:525 start_codon:yes stop_codon:yes gene_type:complete
VKDDICQKWFVLFGVCGFLVLSILSVRTQDSQLALKEMLVSLELTCPSCAQGLERRLLRLPEIKEIEVRHADGEISVKSGDGESIDSKKVHDTVRNAGFIPDGFDVTGIGQVFTRDSVVGITFGDNSFFELAEGDQNVQLLQADALQSFLITGRVDPETPDRIEVVSVKRFSLR